MVGGLTAFPANSSLPLEAKARNFGRMHVAKACGLLGLLGLFGALGCSKASSPIEPERNGALTAAGLFTSPELEGKKVTAVVIVGASSPPRALAFGIPLVELVDGAASAEKARPATGYARSRVTGTLRGKGMTARISVDTVTPWPSEVKNVTLDEIATRPRALDETRVSVQGELVRGDERSSMGEVWISGCSEVEGFYVHANVRATGWLFTDPHGSAGFGHTNAYRAHLQVERCERLP